MLNDTTQPPIDSTLAELIKDTNLEHPQANPIIEDLRLDCLKILQEVITNEKHNASPDRVGNDPLLKCVECALREGTFNNQGYFYIGSAFRCPTCGECLKGIWNTYCDSSISFHAQCKNKCAGQFGKGYESEEAFFIEMLKGASQSEIPLDKPKLHFSNCSIYDDSGVEIPNGTCDCGGCVEDKHGTPEWVKRWEEQPHKAADKTASDYIQAGEPLKHAELHWTATPADIAALTEADKDSVSALIAMTVNNGKGAWSASHDVIGALHNAGYSIVRCLSSPPPSQQPDELRKAIEHAIRLYFDQKFLSQNNHVEAEVYERLDTMWNRDAEEATQYVLNAMAKLPKRESSWQPNYDWSRSGGMDIVRSTLQENNVYFQGKNGDIYRVWLDAIGIPAIELVTANAPLPEQPDNRRKSSEDKV